MLAALVAVIPAASLLDCLDDGPWPCSIDGCPEPQLGCAHLASLGFCSSSFADVWEPPPAGLGSAPVHTLCPRACGRCGAAAPSACNIASLDAAALEPGALEDVLGRADAPLLIRGATGGWPDFTYRRLLAYHAGTTVRVVLEGGTRRGEAARETELTLGDFFPSMRNGSIPAEAYIFFDVSGTGIPQAMPHLARLFTRSLPAAAGGRLLLSAGSLGNGRPFHAHGPALFALLSGVKRWFVRRPGASLPWQLFEVPRAGLGSEAELAVGWEEHLWVCSQRPGELLFVPDQLPHATVNYEAETVGVTFVVDELAPVTPLHHAAQGGSAAAVRALLQRGASVHAVASNGGTPLHYAVGLGHCEAAEALLAAGASVHARARDGLTPLHLAAGGGHLDAAEMLVRRGASLDAVSDHGYTASELAGQVGHGAIAEALERMREGGGRSDTGWEQQ
jgi:hypothetical protein